MIRFVLYLLVSWGSEFYSCQKIGLKKNFNLFVNAISYILVIAGENRCL